MSRAPTLKPRLVALVPGAVLLMVASAVLVLPGLREATAPLISVAIYALALAGVLLGLRFRRARLVLALVVLALVDLVATRWTAPGGPAHAAAIRGVVGLLVPLNLAALAWASDGGGWPRFRTWTLVLAAQAGGVILLLLPDSAEAARALWQTFLAPVQSRWPAPGGPVLIAFGLAFAAVVVRFFLRPRQTESGLLWALVAAFVALVLSRAPFVATLYLAAGGLILVVALIETSYAMAYRDELTGLPARRALNDLLASLGPCYAVAMVDVDHFKKFNDTYGHQAGDQLLRKVAASLMEVAGGGRPFRYGGEEFAIVFPGLSSEEAAPHLEHVREAIAASPFTVRGRGRPRVRPEKPKPAGSRKQAKVTVSIGVADSATAGPEPPAVIKAADEALYRAKRGGRNRLVTAEAGARRP